MRVNGKRGKTLTVGDPTTVQEQSTQGLKTIAKGAGLNLLGSLAALILVTAYQFLLARTLGPSNLGILGLAISLMTAAGVVAGFGVERGVMRFVAQYAAEGDQQRAAGSIISGMRITVVTSLVMTILLFSGAHVIATRVFDKPTLEPVLRIFAFSLPFLATSAFFLSVAQAYKRMEYRVVVEQLLVPFMRIVGLIVLSYVIGRSAVGAAAAIVTATIVGAICAVATVWRLYPLRGQGERPILVTTAMLTFSWPLMLTTLVNRAWSETETLVLGILVTSDQVGIYYASLKVTVLLSVFLTGFSSIFAPMIVELHGKQNQELLGRLFKTVTKWGFTLSLPMFWFVFVFSEELLSVFGPEFVVGAPVLRILAVAQLANVLSGPVGWMLTMAGYVRLNLLDAMLMLALSVPLDLFLVPRYGVVGAAVAGGLTLCVVNLLRLAQVYVKLGVHPYNRSFAKPVVASIGALVSVMACRPLLWQLPLVVQVILLSLVLVSVYGLAIILLKLDVDDHVVVGAFQRRFHRLMRRRIGR